MVYNHNTDSPFAQLLNLYKDAISGGPGSGQAPTPAPAPPSGKRFNDRLPQDPTAPQSPSIDPALFFQQQAKNVPMQSISAADVQGAPQVMSSPVERDFGTAISPPQVMPQSASPQSVPGQLVSQNEAIKTALLQAGLSLMVPQWGGPLAQLGQAAGSGMEAVGRLQKGRQAQQNKGLSTQLTQAQIDATQALTSARKESAETSRVKRLKGGSTGSSQFERLATELQLGPKGSAYFKQRMKEVKEVDPLDIQLGKEAISPMEQFQRILEEARELDAQTPAPAADKATASPETTSRYKKGDIVEGRDGIRWKFKGGDESKRENWEQAK